MEHPFIYINTAHALDAFAKQWKKETVLGIDIECENNLHHYGAYLSIIQLSTKTQNFVIDMLAIKGDDRQPITDILKNPKIEVIFHDYSFDFRMIGSELGITPKNLFDSQLAAQFLCEEKISLGNLIEKFLGIKLEKGFQKADWTKRPLPQDMLSYAIQDTCHLLELKEKLETALKKGKTDKLNWLKQDCKHISSKEWKNPELKFEELKGVKALDDKERAICQELYKLRDKTAKKLDKPAHYILSNKLIKEIAIKPPKNSSFWKKIRCHRIVRENPNLWSKAIESGKKKTHKLPIKEFKKMNQTQKDMLEKLEKLRNTQAKKHKIPNHILMNKQQMIKSITTTTKKEKEKILRPWQQDIMKL